jgi:hypothetical protein
MYGGSREKDKKEGEREEGRKGKEENYETRSIGGRRYKEHCCL